jgi:hypothetical protein
MSPTSKSPGQEVKTAESPCIFEGLLRLLQVIMQAASVSPHPCRSRSALMTCCKCGRHCMTAWTRPARCLKASLAHCRASGPGLSCARQIHLWCLQDTGEQRELAILTHVHLSAGEDAEVRAEEQRVWEYQRRPNLEALSTLGGWKYSSNRCMASSLVYRVKRAAGCTIKWQ